MARCGGAWTAMMVLGACILLPYNCLLTAQPYFDQHAFKGLEFPFTSMLAYSIMVSGGQVVLSFKGQLFTIRARMRVAFSGVLGSCLALLAICVSSRTYGGASLNALCLLFVAVLGLANAIMQSALLGLAGAIGPEMSGAVMLGLGVSGLVSLGISLLLQAIENLLQVSEKSGLAGMIIAAALFLACVAATIFSMWVFFVFLCVRDAPTVAALDRIERERGDEKARRAHGRGLPGRARRGADAESVGQLNVDDSAVTPPASNGNDQLRLVFREVLPQAFNIWFTFVVTMCVFPGVMTRWDPGATSVFSRSRQLFGTLLIGTFQIADVLSRAAASILKKVRPRGLRAMVLLRLLFVPLFMLGQRWPQGSWLWGGDLGRFFLAFALAFTNGLCASCAMMLGPERAAPERREVAGMLMSCAMVLGIFCGTLVAFLTQL